MNDARTLRIVAAVALVLGAALFAVGVRSERSHAETPNATSTDSSHVEGGEEGTEHVGGEGGSAGTEAASDHQESDATLLGIDLESTPFVIAVAAASMSLAAALLRLRSAALLVAVVLFAVAFAIADVQEIVKQVDEGNRGIAALASLVAGLHVVAAIAAGLARRRLRSRDVRFADD